MKDKVLIVFSMNDTIVILIQEEQEVSSLNLEKLAEASLERDLSQIFIEKEFDVKSKQPVLHQSYKQRNKLLPINFTKPNFIRKGHRESKSSFQRKD